MSQQLTARAGSVVSSYDRPPAPRFRKGPHGGWSHVDGLQHSYTASQLLAMKGAWFLVERGPEPGKQTLEEAFEQYSQSLPQHLPADWPSFRSGWDAAGGKP